MILKNKKKVVLTLCTIFIFCIMGTILPFFANANSQGFNYSNIFASEYNKGNTIDLPSVKYVDGGVEYDCSSILYYPDGRETTYNTVTLDVSGKYKVKFSTEVNGQLVTDTKEFVVVDSLSSMFTLGEGVTMLDQTNLPGYIKKAYTGSKQGVMFSAGKEGALINYNGVIDLRDTSFYTGQSVRDMNSQDLRQEFLEMLVTPLDNSAKEFQTLEVRLTDIYDSNNYLTISIAAGDKRYTVPAGAYVSATPCDKYVPIGFPENEVQAKGKYAQELDNGTIVRSSFYGQNGMNKASSMRLYYDTDVNSLWGWPVAWTNQRFIVKDNDFNNPDVVGLENLWNGFTTGEVYCSIRVKNLVASTAHFMVLSIGGHRFEDDFKTGGNNVIAVDYDGLDENNLPKAVADEGCTYPVFNAVAYNTIGGILSKPQVRVYYGDNKEELPINNNQVKTIKEGKYYIEYTSTSQYGSLKKIVEFEAMSPDNYTFSYQAGSGLSDTYHIGERCIVPQGKILGGTGFINTNREIYYSENGLNFSPVELSFVNGIEFFDIDRIGYYKIVYTAKDMLNFEVSDEVIIQSVIDEKPRLEIPYLPAKMIKGFTYRLAAPKGYYFDQTGSVNVKTSVSVNGVDYTDKDFVVDGDFDIVYKAWIEGSSTKITEKIVSVKTIDLLDTNTNYLYKFFVADDVTGDGNVDVQYGLQKTHIEMYTTTDGAKISFIKSLPIDMLNFSFNVDPYRNNFNEFQIKIVDKFDASKSVIVAVRKESAHGKDYSMFAINGTTVASMAGSFNGTDTNAFVISYDKNLNTISDAVGTVLSKVEYYENGDVFEGFPSGEVYLEFFINGVTGESSVLFEKIINQPTSSAITKDITAPFMVMDGDIAVSSYGDLNQTFKLPNARAYDVLSEIVKFTLTITSPSGDTGDIYSGDVRAFDFVLDEIGKYTITYSAKDSSGRTLPAMRYYVFVADETKPEITVVDTLDDEYTVGQVIKLPEVVVSDNIDETPKLYYIVESPTKRHYMFTENVDFKFEMAGTYKIKIYVADDYYNYVVNEISITVR